MIANANALQIPLADKSVHSIITSPPYFNLRDYQIAGQIGLEASPAEYVEALRQFGQEAWRVLRDDGIMFLNLGDSFANDAKWGGATGGKHVGGLHGQSGIGRGKTSTGLRPKSLIGIPWRVAFALQDDGWILRSEIIWEKPNAMPESVTDRPTKAHEHIFLLAKQPRYFYDAEAVREELADESLGRMERKQSLIDRTGAGTLGKQIENGVDQENGYAGLAMGRNGSTGYNPAGRNKRSVWSVPTAAYSGAHFACWPPALVEPMIKCSTPERGVCSACGAPYVRVIKKPEVKHTGKTKSEYQHGSSANRLAMLRQAARDNGGEYSNSTITTGWRPTCQHKAEPIPAIVLDPFTGSGTTGQVCRQMGRRFIGLDLNPEYLGLLAAPRAERKTIQAALSSLPLFAALG